MKQKELIGYKKEIQKLRFFLDHGQHTVILGPKRFGKTSIIQHVSSLTESRYFIYIDLHKATSTNMLALKILNRSFEHAGINEFTFRAQHETLSLIKEINGSNIESVARASLDLINSELDGFELILSALDITDKVAAHLNTKIVIVMDEFQEIVDLAGHKALDQLRSIAQHHEDITYVFMGSVKRKMNNIFQSQDSAFFHFAQTIELTGLDEESVIEYFKQFFELKPHEDLNHDLIMILRYLEFHPDYTQQFIEQIHYDLLISSERVIDRNLCIEALAAVFLHNQAYIEELIDKAKLKKHHYAVLLATANENSVSLPAATLYQTRVSLENMGLLEKKSRDKYVVVDVFLIVFLLISETNRKSFTKFIDECLPKID